MNWVILLTILVVVCWLVWNIYTKLVKNDGEELFLKEKKPNPVAKILDEIDY